MCIFNVHYNKEQSCQIILQDNLLTHNPCTEILIVGKYIRETQINKAIVLPSI